MARGYRIVRSEATNTERLSTNVRTVLPFMTARGARNLVRGGACGALEGSPRPLNPVIWFVDHAGAVSCYRSPAYPAIVPELLAGAEGDIVIVEGLD